MTNWFRSFQMTHNVTYKTEPTPQHLATTAQTLRAWEHQNRAWSTSFVAAAQRRQEREGTDIPLTANWRRQGSKDLLACQRKRLIFFASNLHHNVGMSEWEDHEGSKDFCQITDMKNAIWRTCPCPRIFLIRERTQILQNKQQLLKLRSLPASWRMPPIPN